MNAMQQKINEILSDFAWKKISEQDTRKALSDEGVPNNVIDFMIRSPLYFIAVEEAVEEQPSMFDDEESVFYDDNGLELVNIVRNKAGNKDYIFNAEASDYVNDLLQDPSDVTPIIQLLAQAYLNSDEMSKILDKANRSDDIIFNTSNSGKIKISMNDVFEYITYLKREERFKNK